MRSSVILPLFVPALFALSGCRRSESITLSASDIRPSESGQSKADLMVGTRRFPIDLDQTLSGNALTLTLVAHGEEAEQERYTVSDKEFDLIQADVDVFAPPVPLLRFPSAPGARWDWAGVIREGTDGRDATAHVDSAADYLKSPDGLVTAEKVEVKLAISSGSAVPAERTLSFWFAPKLGLVKREFGAGTTRLPTDWE